MDQSISKFVALCPQVTFKRAQALRDKLVHSHYHKDKRSDPCKDRGTFPVGLADTAISSKEPRDAVHLPFTILALIFNTLLTVIHEESCIS